MSIDYIPVLAASEMAAHLFQWRPFLAPFHSVILHYPIGFVTLVFVLELYRWRRPSAELHKITWLVTMLSLLSSFVAAALGWLRATGGGYEVKTLELHRWFGIAVPFCILFTMLAQRYALREAASRAVVGLYRFLIVGTLAVLVIAGHEGGNLTHGSKYLVEYAPEFVKNFIEDMDTENPPAPGGEAKGVFAEKIRPIFEVKCVSCHGPDKQKGKYRLDTEELAGKPGSSDLPPLKPGDPLQSNLIRVVTLPKDHDDVMPPEGKQPLTGEEVMTLVRWIQSQPKPKSSEETPGKTAPAPPGAKK